MECWPSSCVFPRMKLRAPLKCDGSRLPASGGGHGVPRTLSSRLVAPGRDVLALNVAGGRTLTPTVAATKLGGVVHLIGFADAAAELNLFEAIRHGTTFMTATAGSREDLEAFVRVAELHKLRPAIAKAFSIRDLAHAIEHLERGGHFGKTVLNLDF